MESLITDVMKYFYLSLLVLLFSCSDSSTESNQDNDPKIENDTTNVDPDAQGDQQFDQIDKADSDSEENTTEEVTSADLNYDSDEYEDIDWLEYEKSMTKDFSFVIIISTKSYDAALKRAQDASKKLGYPLDLRGLHPNDEMGLSLPKEVCEAICGGDVVDYPQYLPRNDWGDSKYVSVEYSDGFAGFTKGYYIVVVASGENGDPVLKEALTEAKKFYKDAYAKTCGVWMGCGC